MTTSVSISIKFKPQEAENQPLFWGFRDGVLPFGSAGLPITPFGASPGGLWTGFTGWRREPFSGGLAKVSSDASDFTTDRLTFPAS